MVRAARCPSRLGNIVQPWDVLNAHGADALPLVSLHGIRRPEQERRFSSDLVGEVIRSFTLTLWNVYSFFVTYANLDKPTVTTMPIATSDLDRWLLSELNVLVRDVTEAYEHYDVPNATRPDRSVRGENCPRGICDVRAAASGSPNRIPINKPRTPPCTRLLSPSRNCLLLPCLSSPTSCIKTSSVRWMNRGRIGPSGQVARSVA